MTRTAKILGTLFCVAMGYFIYLSNSDENRKNGAISKNKFTTIAKVYEIESGRNYNYAHFYFFFNEKKYYSSEFITNDMRKTINRYYKVELSIENPKYSQILLEQEISDKTEIVKAGFTFGEPKEPSPSKSSDD